MNIPTCFSVAKSSAFVASQSESVRRASANDWQQLKTVPIILRPFIGLWFCILYALRRSWIFGCYIMLCFAWITRITTIICAIGLLLAIAAAFYDASDSSQYSSYESLNSSSSDSHLMLQDSQPSYTKPIPAHDYSTSSEVVNSAYSYSSPSGSSVPASGYTPRVRADDVADVSRHVYDYALQRNMVDVSGHYRGNTFVQPYQRQPPGGISFDDKAEAAGWAIGAAAVIYGVDYLSQKYDQWDSKKKKEQEQEHMQKLIEKHDNSQEQKRWWQW